MADARIARLADVLVGYSTRVKPGDVALISASPHAADLVREIYRRVLEAGGHPTTRINVDGLTETLVEVGSPAQLAWESPIRAAEMETIDVYFAITAESNTRSLTGADPAKMARISKAGEGIRRRYLARAAAGELRWVVTAFPTNAAAQDAEMSLEEYENFVYRAAFLDDGDPVERWKAFAGELDSVAAFLNSRRELRIVAEGTDLRFRTGGRIWEASRGFENFPDGEVFTAPVETSVEGTIHFTYPGVFQRREVHDVRLRFEGGEVVEATAARGQDFLRQMVGLDEGSRRLGEFAFGLNDAVETFTKNILFDEKIGGTVHLALGESYPETGGVNHSALHWDLICDLRGGSEVYADGELVYRGGAFLPGVLPPSSRGAAQST
jgi:aminopeptidase